MNTNLQIYSKHNKCYEEKLIVCGDFNINVKLEENLDFIDYMKKNWNLVIKNNINISSTLQNTCIDLIFYRNINLDLFNYITYFSVHKPICGKIYIK